MAKKEKKPVIQAPPRDLLERYFADKIISLKQGLDEVYQPSVGTDEEEGANNAPLSQLQSLKAYWNICVVETDECIETFGNVTDATLHPNHRKIMKMTKHYNKLLKANDIFKEEDENSYKCMDFARLAIDYLKSIHTVLLNDKKWTHKKKQEVTDLFMEWEALDYGTETQAEV